jgi:hypothetical protein
MTWFRKEPGVTWLPGFGDDRQIVAEALRLTEERLPDDSG